MHTSFSPMTSGPGPSRPREVTRRPGRLLAASGSRPFLGTSLVLLLPTFVLAVMATLSLARDWRAARRDAVARAQEIAEAVTARLTDAMEPKAPFPGPAGGV